MPTTTNESEEIMIGAVAMIMTLVCGFGGVFGLVWSYANWNTEELSRLAFVIALSLAALPVSWWSAKEVNKREDEWEEHGDC